MTAPGAQHVGHQRAAAGAELGQNEGVGRTQHLPHADRPQADQLAEDLADLGRGDEVAGAAEGVALHVVAVLGVGEAGRHEIGDRDRPAGADLRLELLGERRHAFSTAPGVCVWRRATTIIVMTPTMIIGTDRSMPMVSPPAR